MKTKSKRQKRRFGKSILDKEFSVRCEHRSESDIDIIFVFFLVERHNICLKRKKKIVEHV